MSLLLFQPPFRRPFTTRGRAGQCGGCCSSLHFGDLSQRLWRPKTSQRSCSSLHFGDLSQHSPNAAKQGTGCSSLHFGDLSQPLLQPLHHKFVVPASISETFHNFNRCPCHLRIVVPASISETFHNFYAGREGCGRVVPASISETFHNSIASSSVGIRLFQPPFRRPFTTSIHPHSVDCCSSLHFGDLSQHGASKTRHKNA